MTGEVLIDGRLPGPMWRRLQPAASALMPTQDNLIYYSLEPTIPGAYSVLIDGRVYRVTRGAGSELQANGRTLTAEVFDPRDRRAGPTAASNQGVQHIAASMPGRVVRVLVAKGDQVEEGQGLVVVEAMKMQNEMKSPKAGRVTEVRAAADATVTAGEVLVIVE